MSLLPPSPGHPCEAAIWQDVEYGAYAADLPVWRRLAGARAGAVAELGAGSGRVALDLGRAGFEVIAVERDEQLAAELGRRAEGLPVTVLPGEVTGLAALWSQRSLPAPALAVAPLQVLQLLDEPDRGAALEAVSAVLCAGGRLAAALVDEHTIGEPGVAAKPPTPDMREVSDWVYSSEPLWVQVDSERLFMRRLRERVSPRGDLVRRVHDDVLFRLTADALEAEAASAGLRPVGRHPVGATEHEAGSVIVVLEAPA